MHQIKFKKEHIAESLLHLANVEFKHIHPTIPSPLIYDYRNKMEFSFTDNCWLTSEELKNPDSLKGYALGLHVPGSYDRIMHIEKCWLQDEIMNQILNFSQHYFKNSGLSVFNLKSHVGLLRFLVIRKSFTKKNYMVNIVTFKPQQQVLKDYALKLIRQIPAVVSVMNTVNPQFAQIAFGDEEYVVYGEKTMMENIANFSFEVSINSFFQTNPLQAEKLYSVVQEYVGTKNTIIWDLYAGTGTIALFLSQQTLQVVGFELVESAVEDAYQNCSRNSVVNCKFVSGDIRENILKRRDTPDVIVCDPPRSGMHPDVVNAVVKARPHKIIYVSCNPTTMARDIKQMLPYYVIKEIQPVDMFPHTYHIESVVKLEKQ